MIQVTLSEGIFFPPIRFDAFEKILRSIDPTEIFHKKYAKHIRQQRILIFSREDASLYYRSDNNPRQ